MKTLYYLRRKPSSHAPATVTTKDEPLVSERDESIGRWVIIGSSVTGNGHIRSGTPCQDAHAFRSLDERWCIAVVSDGAGSAVNSHLGSGFLARRAISAFHELMLRRSWLESSEFPTGEEWDAAARQVLGEIRNELVCHSELLDIDFEALSATLIVMLFSSEGILLSHVGDGRAGYMNNEGNWLPAMEPFKGAQVGETAFLTLDIERYPFLVENRVIRDKVKSVVLMTDGCERVSWEITGTDPETGEVKGSNMPFKPFFDSVSAAIIRLLEKEPVKSINEKWTAYLTSGHHGFIEENDDKTMVVGVLR